MGYIEEGLGDLKKAIELGKPGYIELAEDTYEENISVTFLCQDIGKTTLTDDK
jgi:hypothetical protein